MGGDSSETRNLIFAGVLSMAVILGWYALFPPQPPAPPADRPVAEGTAMQGVTAGADAAAGLPNLSRTREAALTLAERVEIDNDALTGSLSLKGGRIDDLHLDNYRETLDPGSDTVTLLNPTGGPVPYYVVYGWLPVQGHTAGPVPDANTPWELVEGTKLTPSSPITLRWDNGQGLIFTRRISVDDRFMFTIEQAVENTSAAGVSLAPYGYVARRGLPPSQSLYILHEGSVGMFDGELSEVGYSDFEDLPVNSLEGGRAEAKPVSGNGWIGFTDKYWMTVLAPRPGQSFDAINKLIPRTGQPDEYRTETRLPVMTVEAGQTARIETNLFAGAKEVQAIRDYMDSIGIDRFDDSVDWGWFYFLTKPIYTLLHAIGGLVGNMGWAIIGLTLLVKLILLPLAYKSYVSMSKMKALQPQMEKIKERCGDDKQKLQQAMIELYKKEKVNPASGCLPILLQIPIFFSLYKVLYVTIEMRHAPFIGWIRDLSAPDPSSWMTLFGAVPWEVPAFLSIFSIGVFPILMGITMWLQQKLNPAPADATQRMIFAWMPWVFMFMLGQFAAGLVIYWTANNIITFTQQYLIMRSQGVNVDLLGNITSSFKKGKNGEAPKK